jgi:hypothetical protein
VGYGLSRSSNWAIQQWQKIERNQEDKGDGLHENDLETASKRGEGWS